MSVTPVPGMVSVVTQAGVSVLVVPPLPNGGVITNPALPQDQGLVASEPLFVDPVGKCLTLAAGGTIFRLEPGQSWEIIPGQTTPTYVNAPSAGHNFSVVAW